MPYRRLPNTDQARIRALNSAVRKGDIYNVYDLAVSFKTLSEAGNFLPRFETAQRYYQQCFDNQARANARHQENVKTARLYVSHFIQVLNLAAIRGEIKGGLKELYGLSRDNNAVPDLSNETALLEWGAKIIKGEQERLKRGGIPIYNPTIAKVTVHYDIFVEGYERQRNLQNLTNRSWESLSSMRERADEIILDIWNQVEKKFEHLAGEERLDKCRDYGVIYYYRSYEQKPE